MSSSSQSAPLIRSGSNEIIEIAELCRIHNFDDNFRILAVGAPMAAYLIGLCRAYLHLGGEVIDLSSGDESVVRAVEAAGLDECIDCPPTRREAGDDIAATFDVVLVDGVSRESLANDVLTRCHKALAPGGTLFIFASRAPEESTSNGQSRHDEVLRTLCDAGFSAVQVREVRSDSSVLVITATV